MDKKSKAIQLSGQINELNKNLIEQLNNNDDRDLNDIIKKISELKNELYSLYPELKNIGLSI